MNFIKTSKIICLGILFSLSWTAKGQDSKHPIRIGLDISKTLMSVSYLMQTYVAEPTVTIPVSDKWSLSISPGYSYAVIRTRAKEKYQNNGFSLKAGMENQISNHFFWSLKAVGSQFTDKATFLVKGDYYGDTTLTTLPKLQTFTLGLEVGLLWRVSLSAKWNMAFQARAVIYDGVRDKSRYIPGIGLNGGSVSGGLNVLLEYHLPRRPKL